MKGFIFAVVALLMLSIPLFAGMPCCAQFDGLYVGANLGWSDDDYQFDDLDGRGQAIDSLPRLMRVEDNGVLGGVQIGYNWQPWCSVIGLEADWSGTNLKASQVALDGDQPVAVDMLKVTNRVRWVGTLRARAGVVVDRLLLYMTAGFAYASTKQTGNFFEDAPASVDTVTRNHIRLGGVGGVGAEWALFKRWSLKAEVLYIRLAQDKFHLTSTFVNPGLNYQFQSHESLAIGRIGINYRWGCF